MKLTNMALNLQIKQVSEEGAFEGYASQMTRDRGGDIVDMGAFDRSIAKHKANNTMPKMLWQHDPSKVVGVWDEMRQDENGLYVKGRCVRSTSLGKDCHELLRAGAIDSMSIGYVTLDSEYEDGGDTRRLKEVDLWEISLVTFPMNEDARVTAVKRIESIRDVERLLRDGGVPGQFAKLVALHGFEEAKARIDARRDGGNEALAKALKELGASLKRKQENYNA
jgi:HK97 family phage prohead protease